MEESNTSELQQRDINEAEVCGLARKALADGEDVPEEILRCVAQMESIGHSEDHSSLPQWNPPRCVNHSAEAARPGYVSGNASEYMDDPETLILKVKVLASMIRSARGCCVYTGAGLSTATGMPDYASKAKGSKAPHLRGANAAQPKRSLGNGNRLQAAPTQAHCVLAAMEKKKLLHHW